MCMRINPSAKASVLGPRSGPNSSTAGRPTGEENELAAKALKNVAHFSSQRLRHNPLLLSAVTRPRAGRPIVCARKSRNAIWRRRKKTLVTRTHAHLLQAGLHPNEVAGI